MSLKYQRVGTEAHLIFTGAKYCPTDN